MTGPRVRYRSDRVQIPPPVIHVVDLEASDEATRLHAVCGRALVQENLEVIPETDHGAVCDMCVSEMERRQPC